MNERLIIDFTQMLTGSHVSSQAINSALTLICNEFDYDCGCIYEIDQLNVFHLKESLSKKGTRPQDSFSVNNSAYIENINNCGLYFFLKGNTKDERGEKLLSLFNAQALTIIAMGDESGKICGIIAFINSDKVNKIAESVQPLFTAILNIFGRYVNIRLYHNKLSFAQNSLESILDNTGIDIYVNDFYTHEILYANKSMAAPYGGKQNFYGRKCWEVLFPGQTGQCEFCPQKKIVDENGMPTKIYSWNYQRPFDGAWFRVFSTAFRWVDGRLAHVVSSADITENKKNEEFIKYIANYDSLTNLPNRRKLVADCEKLISILNENEKCFVMFFDIDGFKSINDKYGHDSGDEFLQKLGEFFSGIPLLKNNIYRNGGDEFVGLLRGGLDNFALKNLVGFIHERFKKPWKLKRGEVFCNTSVGIACYPEDGVTPEMLLNKSDKAMYLAKKVGGGKLCFALELEKTNE